MLFSKKTKLYLLTPAVGRLRHTFAANVNSLQDLACVVSRQKVVQLMNSITPWLICRLTTRSQNGVRFKVQGDARLSRPTKSNYTKFLFLLLTTLYLLGFIPEEQHLNPVQGASEDSWNPQSFWYYPWGRSGTHKGIDIFANEDTPVIAPSQGIVLYSGSYGRGGQVIYLLSPNWHFHYFAHLRERHVEAFSYVTAGQVIGSVGTTGNAKGKPPHLHYSISTLLPRIWKYDPRVRSSWKRMFYLDPGKFITQS